MSQKTQPPDSSPEQRDRVTEFAHQALDGTLVVGPDVRNAARRHLRDLEDAHERGYVWSPEAAARAIAFFEEVLFLNGGDYEGRLFLMAPWQCFVVGSLFGWLTVDGYRRFRMAFIETGKGSGKSPLVAGIGLYGLVADGEMRAEIYAAATKKDQAMILFRDAVAMVNLSKHLRSRVVQSGRDEKVWNLYYPNSFSFFKAISSDEGQSGPRPHIGLIDEVHEHKTSSAVDMLRAGTKNRRRAMVVMITNSGSDKKTTAGQYHDLGVKVCQGRQSADSFFAFICSLDEGDDPFKDESCWPKVNPSLDFIVEGQTDGIPGRNYLREQVQEAHGLPSKEAVVRRLNFCQWTQATAPWIGYDVWKQAEERVPMSMLRDRPCVAGLDLSSTTDLTAFVLLFYPTVADPHWRLLPYFWIPDHELEDRERRDQVPYRLWIKDGELESTPGRAISKLFVLRRLQTICAYFQVRRIGYDRWRIEDLLQLMSEHDISLPELGPFGQGYKDMGPAVDEFERRLLGMAPEPDAIELDADDWEELPDLAQAEVETLRHDGNPVLTWCAGNAVTTSDPAGNRKPDKGKATARIDGIVASVMATGISTSTDIGGGKSIYDEGIGI
ncbi:MAG TPA: phage terminase small subunit P27 family [Pseudomonas sp.]|nr:phage terminase small subunit P27 family [Pseudomonas sp.]MBB50266.1 phage terminase small subunit P27 family [Pseudomonadales bacterium]MBB50486.1 phage terminase small subunit P27 family [Pseudomonadales bacterium]HCA25247.1 phage terminase small subunit P27 family [Pseudomonas sp.]|tara:strand:+ start:14494 stop:16323 length:1830 start_codon:yes stop_codon:yes gene_type:complete